MSSDAPIGVFDSGIGGLTVVGEMIRLMPFENMVYVGDHARCPYGDKDASQVRQYAREICDFFMSLHVKLMVVACNTATAVALDDLRARYDVPVLGVVVPGAEAAVQSTHNRKIGVIATQLTTESGVYKDAIHERMKDATIIGQACPTFVPMVERGEWSGPSVEAEVRRSLEPLLTHGLDTLILGCTHYPMLESVIRSQIPNSMKIVSSATAMAESVHRFLTSAGLLRDCPQVGGVQHDFYTTGNPASMSHALETWLSRRPEEARVITLRTVQDGPTTLGTEVETSHDGSVYCVSKSPQSPRV